VLGDESLGVAQEELGLGASSRAFLICGSVATPAAPPLPQHLLDDLGEGAHRLAVVSFSAL
jgi:hypothetical protein